MKNPLILSLIVSICCTACATKDEATHVIIKNDSNKEIKGEIYTSGNKIVVESVSIPPKSIHDSSFDLSKIYMKATNEGSREATLSFSSDVLQKEISIFGYIDASVNDAGSTVKININEDMTYNVIR